MPTYPHPELDTGLGFYYFPDDNHYRAADLERWLPELTALGASWLTLFASPVRAVPEPFIRALLDVDIEPIIHIPIAPAQPVAAEALEPLYTAYARWGVHYVVLYDQPNVRLRWRPDDWAKPGLVERFVELILPSLLLARQVGLTPVFPALKQGGDYWDTSFLDTAIQALKAGPYADLLNDLVFAHYGFAFNRPASWGIGGHTRWPLARPYFAPPGSQDGRGFRSFEWYADVIKARIGQPRPLLMIAGGCRLGDADDPALPPVDESRHTSCNIEIAAMITQRQLPEYVMNVSYWLLSAPASHPHHSMAWFKADGSALPVAAELRKALAQPDPATASTVSAASTITAADLPPAPPAPATSKSITAKPIYHYLLLPTFEWGVSDWHWTAALEYIHSFRPTTGFSAEEARAAEHVTIVGNEQGVSLEAEAGLLAAGCKVERIIGRDGADTQKRLDAMAKSGRRFLSE